MTKIDPKMVEMIEGAAKALETTQEKAKSVEAEQKRVAEEGKQQAFDLLFVQGLYASVAIDNPVGEVVEHSLRNGVFGFDAYCTTCKRETTFRVAAKEVANRGTRPGVVVVPPRLLAIHATCQRDWTVYTYIVKITDKRITKIGQWPSLADVAFGELRTIDRSLDEVDRRELGKALGLFAHELGVGCICLPSTGFRTHD